MATVRAHRFWLAAIALLAACDRADPPVAATENNVAAVAPPASTASPISPGEFPELTGRVVDNAGVLAPEVEASLTEKLAALEQRTSDQLVVVTVGSLDGRSIEEFSNDLARHWRLGQAEQDNGVLLMVAPSDRRTRIAVGYGLEGILSYEQAQQIVDRDLLPAFRAQRWAEGISTAVDSIVAILIAAEATPRGRAS